MQLKIVQNTEPLSENSHFHEVSRCGEPFSHVFLDGTPLLEHSAIVGMQLVNAIDTICQFLEMNDDWWNYK